ncbi:hypothetical protein Agub_g10432 [Astrephomene gubernaculifera]|uniref:Serine/threonine-protein phosphatase 4 regulatory subunit 3-like central domain-containing protein n=1 Tax=Astrephomene gubernaculifera TaxID=47775 RepID=A0AAD3DUW9_9CHLO|nr:hypothetical protein Agub_g10432 [Astrephomene gubernaculifera]
MHTGFSMHRVKVYKLNAEGQWEDKGTGHISVEYMEQAHAMGLVVISEEENGKTLLVHQISREDIYTRSGESTIITWHDAEISTDVAISFQEQVGCDHIWQQIKQVQREEHMRHQDHERGRKSSADEYDQPSTIGGRMGNGEFMDSDSDLPAPERRNLEEIAKALTHLTPLQRDRVAAQLLKQNYLPALLDLFKQCEDLEDSEGLTHMYAIVRGAIMLNDSGLLEEMLREEHVMDVLGALEYDPDVKQPQKHREFLQSQVQFKEVVPISNPQILAKIHQTYRIQYLKDVILPRSLDDATYATLSSLALFNNMEVVGALMSDPAFLPQLFQRLQQADTGDVQWHDLVAFLQEFCSLARHLQQQQRASLFSRLTQLGLFEVVTRIMLHSGTEVKLRATDILMSSMQHDVLALREFLYKQSDHTLFGLLVHELTDGTDAGLAEQVCEALRLLMDPDTMEQPVEKNEFLEVFYDKYLDRLTGVILSDSSISSSGTRAVPASTLGLILELLSFCVQNHSYRIRYYTLRNHLVEKVLRLLHRRERWLVCATVRFMRVCVALKEDFFTRYLLRQNCFGPLMVVFFENGERYNLLNSAVLDLIEFIRRENIKPLLDHLVENYGHRFDELSYVETFKQLRLKYEQAPERAGSAGGNGPRGDEDMADASGSGAGSAAAAASIRGRTYVFPAAASGAGGASGTPHGRAGGQPGHGRRRRRDERDMDKDEEDYFSEDADDEHEDVQRPHSLHQNSERALRDDGGSGGGFSSQGAAAGGYGGSGGHNGGGHGGSMDLGSRNGPRVGGSQGASGANRGGSGAGAEEADAAQRGDGGGQSAARDLAPHGSGAGGNASARQPQQQQQQEQSAAGVLPGGQRQQEASQPWPGLVDYDDDDEGMVAGAEADTQQQQQREPQQPASCVDSSPQQQQQDQQQQQLPENADGPGNGTSAAAAVHVAAGDRGPSVDLGRRPRSEDDEGKAGLGEDEVLGQEQRKRLRNDDPSAAVGRR